MDDDVYGLGTYELEAKCLIKLDLPANLLVLVNPIELDYQKNVSDKLTYLGTSWFQ